VGAAIERHAEASRIGYAAAADVIARLDEGEAAAGLNNAARRGNPGRACSHDNNVDIAGGRNSPECRRRSHGGGPSEKRAAVERHLGLSDAMRMTLPQ
jgi:hypothetical protein